MAYEQKLKKQKKIFFIYIILLFFIIILLSIVFVFIYVKLLVTKASQLFGARIKKTPAFILFFKFICSHFSHRTTALSSSSSTTAMRSCSRSSSSWPFARSRRSMSERYVCTLAHHTWSAHISRLVEDKLPTKPSLSPLDTHFHLHL